MLVNRQFSLNVSVFLFTVVKSDLRSYVKSYPEIHPALQNASQNTIDNLIQIYQHSSIFILHKTRLPIDNYKIMNN